jgi:hypothetical protein
VTSMMRSRAGQAGQATPSVVAVVSVVAIVAAMVAFFAGTGDEAEVAATPPAQEPAATASGSPQDAPTATRTAEPADRAGGDRADGDRSKNDRKQQRRQRQPAPEPETGPPSVYVEVYNNTGIDGLAAARAAELQDAGWQVVGVDNWHGDIPSSTVYHPAGMESEAAELAEELGVARVRGAVAPMKFDRLTVILTPDAA